jgi:hypothetical protein
MRPMAEVLERHGITTGNVEYWRVGHAGGDWPGSFRDLVDATDYLRVLAGAYPSMLRVQSSLAIPRAGTSLRGWRHNTGCRPTVPFPVRPAPDLRPGDSRRLSGPARDGLSRR